jgi:hypothetical protein
MSLFGIGVGLLVVILLCLALSIRTNVELVLELQARDKPLYEKLGEPRLIGYEWVGLPGNKAYSTWLREVAAAEPESRYSVLARRLNVLRIAFYVCWLSALVVAIAF